MAWNETSSPPLSAEPITSDEEIKLWDLLIVLAQHKRLLIRVPLICAIVAAVASLFLHDRFTADTKILAPQRSPSIATAMLGQLGPLAGVAANTLGLQNPSQMYVSMLKSRTVADAVIKKFDLLNVYGVKHLSDAEAILADNTSISASNDGIITVSVEDTNAKRAADVANNYVEQLQALTQTLGVTEASRRRIFFESQLREAKDNLSNAEAAMKLTQESTGLIQPEGQARAIIDTVASLSRQTAAKEVQLRTMRAFATAQNPDVVRTEEELAGLRAQMGKLEHAQQARRGDVLIATGSAPSASLEYVRKLRDVKYYETVFEILARQYEIARLDESREAAIIQVFDSAVAPEKKSKPKRSIIVLLTAVASGFVCVFGVFIYEAVQRSTADPENAARVEALKHSLSLHRGRLGFRSKVGN
jgi:tyrosine-protein kinase Etk/Wzc